MLVTSDPVMAARASLARSAGGAESPRDPSCGVSSLLGTAVHLKNILTIIPGRPGCAVSHSSVWLRGARSGARGLCWLKGMCSPKKPLWPHPDKLLPRCLQWGCSPGASVTPSEPVTPPAAPPSQGSELSRGHSSGLGCPPLLRGPEHQRCWRGPRRSPVAQLPLALSVPVLLLPLCILQAHSDVR